MIETSPHTFFVSPLFHPFPSICPSLLKKRLVSQSSRVDAERADRELGHTFKWSNDRIDVRRGIRQPDFMWGRTWSEIRTRELWTNIDGPSPGGNQQMPVGTDDGRAGAQGACLKVRLLGVS